MKTIILLSMLLLFSLNIFAQNLEGVWVGKIIQDGSFGLAPTEYIYGLKLEQSGNSAIGRAYIERTSSGVKSTGEFDISLTVFSNSIYYKDLAITSVNMPSGGSWCIKEGRLNYDSKNNRIYGRLSGSASSNGYTTICNPMSIELYKYEPTTSKPENPPPKKNENSWVSSGTGFVIDPRGIIATNYHVVEDSSVIEVDFGRGDDKRSYKCEVLVTDKKNDLALIRITDKAFSGFGFLPYALKTSSSKVGESIFALGYPETMLMGTDIKYTKGDLSALSGFQGDPTTYTLSLSIQHGNSGGPLFDTNGNLIGITSSKVVKNDIDNVSYAIKALYLKNLIDLSSYKINPPTTTSLTGKPITDQIEILSNYVGFIKVK